MKYPIRYFSVGLFTASLILLIGYFFFEPKETLSSEGPIDEMITNIEKEGFRVISESEYISLATAKNELSTLQKDEEKNNVETKDDDKKDKSEEEAEDRKDEKDKKDKKDKTDNNDQQNKKDDQKKKDKNKKDKDKVKTYTLVVKENMVPSMISQKLAENDIIKDAAKLDKFMEDNNYSPYLQIGEFKLKSDMSLEEIAKAITNR